jgi:SAM-dependent methyltransferase
MDDILVSDSNRIASEFQKAVSTMRPRSAIVDFRCKISQIISLKITDLIQILGFNKKQIYKENRKSIILNIGCADHLDSSYINADIFPPVGRALRILLGKGKIDWNLFINIVSTDYSLVNVADGIILAHVLEHVAADQSIKALKNCYSYLKPGGEFRISVPHIRAYPFLEDISSTVKKAEDAINRNALIYGHFHQFMYEPELLALLLESVGFFEIKIVDFGQGLLGESDRHERKDESIYITAMKPI